MHLIAFHSGQLSWPFPNSASCARKVLGKHSSCPRNWCWYIFISIYCHWWNGFFGFVESDSDFVYTNNNHYLCWIGTADAFFLSVRQSEREKLTNAHRFLSIETAIAVLHDIISSDTNHGNLVVCNTVGCQFKFVYIDFDYRPVPWMNLLSMLSIQLFFFCENSGGQCTCNFVKSFDSWNLSIIIHRMNQLNAILYVEFF